VRLGATSWQVPGTYLDNARLLSGHASFSELLVYTWNDELRSMLEQEWDDMSRLLEVSVHLPADSLEHAAAALRFFSDREVLRYTVHPVREVAALRDFLRSGVDMVGERLCLENLENDVFEEVMPSVADIPFSVTLDYGHLLFMGAESEPFLDMYADRIRELHFHGYDGVDCHVAPDEPTITRFGEILETWFQDEPLMPVCVETFDWDVTRSVLDTLAARSVVTAAD